MTTEAISNLCRIIQQARGSEEVSASELRVAIYAVVIESRDTRRALRQMKANLAKVQEAVRDLEFHSDNLDDAMNEAFVLFLRKDTTPDAHP